MRDIIKTLGVCLIMTLIAFSMFACSNNDSVNAEGEFYTLTEAYAQGLLTEQDIKNIAYYYAQNHSGSVEGLNEKFIPNPKNPKELSVENIINIRTAYITKFIEPYKTEREEIDIERVSLSGYYGTYNGCVSFTMSNSYFVYPDGALSDIDGHNHEIVAGITFNYRYPSDEIVIWK